jgi:cytochrome c oxidase cbb3-type subunit 4
MDINLMRSLVTLAALVAFVGIAVWAWWPSRQKQFDDAASLPFREGE